MVQQQRSDGQVIQSYLGYGFLEKVYENALWVELQRQDLQCITQHPIMVYYSGKCVGKYFADIMVAEKIILELKATETLHRQHEFQLINYLRATEAEIGLLLNFGKNRNLSAKFKQIKIITSDRPPDLLHQRSIRYWICKKLLNFRTYKSNMW